MRWLTRPGRRAAQTLAWIDEFFREAGPHLFAREEDGVIILPPNQVYKANPTGISIVRHLQEGRRAADIPGIDSEERAAQVGAFISDIRSLYLGEPAADGRAPYQTVPYDFQYTRLPILGEIAVTYRCNNACRFCYAGCGTSGCTAAPRAVTGSREMSLAEICRVIRLFREEAKIPFFSFTGGEPLLRPDLEDMVRFARSHGLQVNLITNGTLASPDRARSLYQAGLRTAQVSLESPEAAVHDSLTARPGSWRATREGISNLQAAGISVQTNTTVCAANAAQAADMPAFLKTLGISRFAMNLYLPGQDASDGLLVPYSRAGSIVDAVQTAARAQGMVFYWYSPLPHCHYNTIARGLGNKSCAAMDGLLSVSPSADVLPCSSYPEPMGNLLTTPFSEIWFSERARHFKTKQYAPAECAGCSRFVACQAACPLYWKSVGTAELANRAGTPTVASAGTPAAAFAAVEE
ncbi:MAG TPA: radical SAM protein [Spirochaetia bacterium]|nr:radical SAM protein [Spirochaetia bacterium]